MELQQYLGVFAKEPKPGAVKTRLAATIGEAQAARLYDAFLRDWLPRLITVRAVRVLAFAPPSLSARGFFTGLVGNRFELERQSKSDLGGRMAKFFRRRFSSDGGRVVLVGSDSPDMPLSRIDDAFKALKQFDIVYGPCDDGGFYLIGMRRMVLPVFLRIDWSGPDVLAQSLRQLEGTPYTHSLLAPWYDVDRIEDVRRLAAEIAAARQAGRDPALAHTEAVLRTIDLTGK